MHNFSHTYVSKGRKHVSPHGGLKAFIMKMYQLCSPPSNLRKARHKLNEELGEGSVVGNGWAWTWLHTEEQLLLWCSSLKTTQGKIGQLTGLSPKAVRCVACRAGFWSKMRHFETYGVTPICCFWPSIVSKDTFSWYNIVLRKVGNKNTCTIDYISVYFPVRCHTKGVEAVVTSKKEKQWETSMWFQTKMFILDYDMQNEDLKLWCASYLPVTHHLRVEVCSITGIVKEVKLLCSNILCSSPYCTIWTVTVYILLLLCYYSIFLYK